MRGAQHMLRTRETKRIRVSWVMVSWIRVSWVLILIRRCQPLLVIVRGPSSQVSTNKMNPRVLSKRMLHKKIKNPKCQRRKKGPILKPKTTRRKPQKSNHRHRRSHQDPPRGAREPKSLQKHLETHQGVWVLREVHLKKDRFLNLQFEESLNLPLDPKQMGNKP